MAMARRSASSVMAVLLSMWRSGVLLSLCCLCAIMSSVLWNGGDVLADMLHEHLAICESQVTSRKRKWSFRFEIASLLSFWLHDSDRTTHEWAIGDSEDGGSQGGSRCMAWVAS